MFIVPGATVERSKLVGPVAIAAGAAVVNCQLGPYVAVGPNARLEGSGLRNAIVMEGATVLDSPDLRDSMLGRHVQVCRAARGTRLILGDHSQIDGLP